MISTATAAVNAVSRPAPAPSQPPRVPTASADDDRHEDAGDPVGQPLHVGLAVLRLLDQPRHLRQLGVGADPGGPHDEPAADVDGRPGDRVAGADLDRHRLAGQHRRVDGGGAAHRRRRRWRPSRRGARRTRRRPRSSADGDPRPRRRRAARRRPWRRARAGRAGPRRPGAWPAPRGSGRPAGTWSRRRRPRGRSAEAVAAGHGQLEGVGQPRVAGRPKNSATSDQPKAASTPSETSVSIVVAPWRRLAHAARWNGHAPHTTTGAASVSDSHCQSVELERRDHRQRDHGHGEHRADDEPLAQGGQLELVAVRGRSRTRRARVVGQRRGVVPGGRDGGEQVVGADGLGDA